VGVYVWEVYQHQFFPILSSTYVPELGGNDKVVAVPLEIVFTNKKIPTRYHKDFR